MSGGSRFQSLTVLGKNDIFLVSIDNTTGFYLKCPVVPTHLICSTKMRSPKIHCIIFNMMKEAITWQKQRNRKGFRSNQRCMRYGKCTRCISSNNLLCTRLYKYAPNLENLLTQQYACVMCTLWYIRGVPNVCFSKHRCQKRSDWMFTINHPIAVNITNKCGLRNK
jgi:hypothetical protein